MAVGAAAPCRGGYVSLFEQVTPYMAAAARAYGAGVLTADADTDADASAALGLRLLREIFGAHLAEGQLPAAVEAVIADPDDPRARDALESEVYDTLFDNPGLLAEAGDTLTRFLRQEIAAGNAEAMVGLGDLLRWQDDPEGARVAYQQAIDCGNAGAMIDLARLLRGDLGVAEEARAWLERAADSGDAEVAAEAAVALGQLLMASQHEAQGAWTAFERAIGSGHPEWAPMALVSQGDLLRRLGDADGAQVAYQEAVDSGNAGCAAEASIRLGHLLKELGDIAGARASWQRVIESGNYEWAAPAFTELVNLLREHNDVDGLRAAHHTAAEAGNPGAPYALEVIGQVLEHEGDIEGAHAAYQQAIDSGYEFADGLLERMSPSAEPDEDPDHDGEPADLPPHFDPRNVVRTGINVLDRALPELPDSLTRQMSVPVASWKADACAVVLFLAFSGHRGDVMPVVTMATFARDGDHWTAHQHWHGTGWSHDPITRPGDLRDLGGEPIVYGGESWAATPPAPGHPAAIVTGRASPEVKYIACAMNGEGSCRRRFL
jgi:tetratricopeptide (TPR) repeat protein